MVSGDKNYCDDLEGWNEIAMGLCKLKMANEWADDFAKELKRYMSPADRLEITDLNIKYNNMYWKYWEKLVRKIRGI